MEIDDTLADTVAPDSDAESEPDALGDHLREAMDAPRDVEGERQKAKVAAALFDEPETPVKIGRFTIVREIGAGGMGMVYLAYDEQLDRRVAVKLLHSSEGGELAQARLQREAKAMARLSHPNVVTVHEVGGYAGQVFVAMEFVDGEDLRSWMAEGPRGWRSVVEIFLQAGEGLAAAHEAGLVHRDFKPDNVLIGRDGRVKVADFGLAHALDRAREPQPAALERVGELGELDSPLTRTGALMGTPAYMAPEQYALGRADARSDQFAYCVALWEGLYGRRPFSGKNLAALSQAISDGEIEAPPEQAEVPPWLHELLVRGLSPKPEERWTSMRELLVVLGDDPQLRRQRLLRAASVALVTVTLVLGLSWVAAREARHNARQNYWSTLTEALLEIERERGFAQAMDDAQRARDATRMSVFRRYRPEARAVDHADSTVAAVVLREVEGVARETRAWISGANETLGQPLSASVLRGHRAVVSELVFAPEGPILYSGAADGEVWRWNYETGAGERVLVHDKAGEITGLALAEDGRLFSSGRDGAVRSWARGAEVEGVLRHEGEITSLELGPGGRWLLTASKDHSARLTQLDGDGRVELLGHSQTVYAAHFSPTGARVVTASSDRSARVWRSADGELLAVLEGHTGPIFHADFVDEDTVVTASDDGSVRSWRLGQAGPVEATILSQVDTEITDLAVHGSKLAAAARDGRVSVGSVDGSVPWRVIDSHRKDVWSVDFSPDGDALISASFDTTARLHALRPGLPSRVFTGHRLAILSAELDPGGRWLATGSWDGEVRVWDLQRPQLETPLLGHRGGIRSIEFDAGGTRVLTASRDGSARLWSADTGRALATFDGGQEVVNKAVFSPSGALVATATRAGLVELWEVEGGALRVLEGHRLPVWEVAFDGAGERVASASSDGTTRVWRVDGELLQVLRGHEDRVIAVSFGPEDELATASDDGSVRLWDAGTGEVRAILRGHEGLIIGLARGGPGGRMLATASHDGSARLWPGEDPEAVLVLAGHAKPVWSVRFDASGERVVTASQDGSAKLWSTADGSLLASLEGHAEGLWAADFAGPSRVITAANDGSVWVWYLDGDGGPVPVVLQAHGDAVMSLAVDPGSGRIATGSTDASAKLWRLDLLSPDPDRLHERLDAATSFCLGVEQREREFGVGPVEARAATEACERRYGR